MGALRLVWKGGYGMSQLWTTELGDFGGGSLRLLPDGVCICGECRACRRADRAAGMPINDTERPISVSHVRVRNNAIEDRTPANRAATNKALRERRFAARVVGKNGKLFAPGVMTHGTITGYSSWGCQCVECLEAGRIKSREKKAAKRERQRGA